MNTLNVVESVFFNALEKETPEARAAYLTEACHGDAKLRHCVERLLNAHPKADGIIPAQAPGLDATLDQPSIDERPGSVIGPYKLLQQLGEGGFGVVFMAEQEQPVRRRVALKIIKPGMDSKQVVARFEAERQALAIMDHPNISRVLDGGATESGRPYFVMELVKGIPITEFCDKNRLTPRERLELFIPVCNAVQHAHQKGIIHRDIKPSNVLVTMYDDKPVPKVIDFGVAKAIEQKLTEQTLFTRVGQIIGTLEYMSPEQATLNALDVDTRADVYALGVLLYELLTGTTPLHKDRLQGVAFLEMLRLIREVDPPKPSTRLSESGDALASYAVERRSDSQKLPKLVKGELDWIAMRALEKDRTRRYATANALAADVQRYLKDEQVEACPPTLGYRLQKYLRKNKAFIGAMGTIAAVLLLGIAATTWQAIRATDEEIKTGQALVLANDNAEQWKKEKKIAHDERDEKVKALDKERDARENLRRTLYFARSNLLQIAWDSNHTGQVLDLLEQQCPGPGERDLRGFEWHYRDRLCHQELLSITNLGGENPVPIYPEFSPDGRFVVAQAVREKGTLSNNEIAVYDLATGKERTRLQIKSIGGPYSLTWGPTSKRILVRTNSTKGIGVNGPIGSSEFVVFDSEEGHEIYRVPQPNQLGFKTSFLFNQGAFSPDGKYLATSSPSTQSKTNTATQITDAETGKLVRSFESSAPLAFSADGRRCAANVSGEREKEGFIKVWDVATGQEVFSKPMPFSPYNPLLPSLVAFSPDGERLSAIIGEWTSKKSKKSQTSTLKVWDIKGGKEIGDFTLLRDSLDTDGRVFTYSYEFNAAGTRLAGYSNSNASPFSANFVSGDIRLFDTTTGLLVDTLRDGEEISCFQFSPDGKMAAAGGRDSTVRVWDLDSPNSNHKPALLFRGHTGAVSRLAFHPDGSRLFTACTDGAVKVWDVSKRGDQPILIEYKARFGGDFAFNLTAGRLAITGRLGSTGKFDSKNQRETSLWDLSGKQLGAYANPAPSVGFSLARHPIALSPDGTQLAMIVFHGSPNNPGAADLRVVEALTGKEIFTRKEPRAIQLSNFGPTFSKDGKTLVWGASFSGNGPPDTQTSEVKVLDASDGKVLRIILLSGRLWDMGLNQDSTRLAISIGTPSASGPGKVQVKLLDLKGGVEPLTLEGTSSSFITQGIIFNPDGTRVAAISYGMGGIGGMSDVVVWDAKSGRLLYTLRGHSNLFDTLTFSPDSRRIATASRVGRRGRPGFGASGEVKIWDAATGNELMTLKDLGPNSALYLGFNSEGTHLYAVGLIHVGAQDNVEIRTWDATPRETPAK